MLSSSSFFIIKFFLVKDSFALVLYKSIAFDATFVQVQEFFSKEKPKN